MEKVFAAQHSASCKVCGLTGVGDVVVAVGSCDESLSCIEHADHESSLGVQLRPIPHNAGLEMDCLA